MSTESSIIMETLKKTLESSREQPGDDGLLLELTSAIQQALEHTKNEQLTKVLELLHNELLDSSTVGGNKDNTTTGSLRLARIGWDLLHPLFPIATRTMEYNTETSRIATALLLAIAECGNAREMYMLLLERLGWIARDATQLTTTADTIASEEEENEEDSCHTKEKKKEKMTEYRLKFELASMEINLLVDLFIMVLPKIKTARLWQFVIDLCDTFERVLISVVALTCFEDKVPLNDTDDSWPFTCSQAIVKAILKYATRLHQWSTQQSTSDNVYHLQNDTNYLRLLTVRLLLIVADKYTTQRNLGLSTAFYYKQYPKYAMTSRVNGADTMDTHLSHMITEWRKIMQSILNTSITCGLDVCQLLEYRMYKDDTVNDHQQLIDEQNYTISEQTELDRIKRFPVRGMLALFAYANIAQRDIFNDNSTLKSNTNWIPWIITPRWLFVHAMYFAYQGIELMAGKGGHLEEATSDIALAALLPALQLLHPNTFEHDACTHRLCVQPTTVAQLIQSLTTVASTSPNAKIRFVAFRTLAMTVATADDIGEAILLGAILRHCPFPMMRAATVGLIREAVHRSQSLNNTQESIFNSNVFWEIFGPLLFLPNQDTLPATVLACNSATWQEDWFIEYTEFIIHVLNLYIYLLIRDQSEQKLGICQPDHMQKVQTQLLDPVRRCATSILTAHRETTPQTGDTSTLVAMFALNNALDRIDQLVSSPH
ncbi:hypothetical protein BDF19DRAFT_455276 [Syncephalis fuscata]|nr:hypothetical protein BDF19DRAFT_455276 [Syncephalis fuscata]